jgi:hypothetical protein
LELVDFGHDEGRALVLRQPTDVVDEVTQVAAALHLIGQTRRGCRRAHGRRLAPRSQNVEAAVAGSGVEPSAQMLRRFALHELPVSRSEGVLHGVLRR